MVPAMAVPKHDPRLDTLRDTPDISPWRCSGKADCTTLTDGGEHDAQAQASKEQSWGEVPGARVALDHGHQQKDTGDGRHEAAHDVRSLLEPLGQAAGGER